MLAEHALRTTTGQADQAAERLGLLRRAQQRHLGWMEAHDADLRVQERAVAREDAWRRRVDQRALALDPPGWLLAELGPVPTDPQERRVWRVAAAELDGYRRAYGLDHHRAGEACWGQGGPGRAGGCAGHPARRRGGPTGPASSPGAAAAASAVTTEATAGSRRTAADQRHRVDPGRLLGAEPRRAGPRPPPRLADRPGRPGAPGRLGPPPPP